MPADRVYEAITTQSRWRKISVIQRASARPEDLQKARQLGKDVFSEMGPDGEDALFEFLQKKAVGWQASLSQYKTLADTGNYPGRDEIADGLSLLRAVLALDQSNKFIERFNERKSDLLDLGENFRDLQQFYEHQRPTWERLRAASERFNLNRLELERDEKAAPALRRIGEILAAASPYGLVHETDQLIKTVAEVNDQLVAERRKEVVAKLDAQIAAVGADVADAGGDESLRATCLRPLEGLRDQIATEGSLAHISQAEREAVRLGDLAVQKIEAFQSAKSGGGHGSDHPPKVKRLRVIRAADLSQKKYLESPEDVTSFLEALRHVVDEALAKDERIEIR